MTTANGTASQPLQNRLLAVLDAEDLEFLASKLTPVMLEKGALLYDPGDMIDTVYFPDDCVISLMTLMESGAAIESATIGREDALGLMAAVSPRQSLSRAIVQAGGKARRSPAANLHRGWEQIVQIRDLMDRHNEALFAHAIHSVACNALHSVEARFCRWLLSCHDRIDSSTVS